MNIGNGIGVGLLLVTIASPQLREHSECQPGGRVLVDAHNAYPEEGRHGNRIARAIATGMPVAIEQDLVWCKGANGVFDVFVAHETTCRGDEPTLRKYFFESVQPLVEAALASGQTDDWPIVTLNLDFKMDPPEPARGRLGITWRVSCLADDRADGRPTPDTPAPMEVGPILVLTGQADAQEASFHDAVPIGDRLLLFGAVHDAPPPSDAADWRDSDPDAGHELPPLVESSLAGRRARRPAGGGRVDADRRARLTAHRHGSARRGPVDPLLHLNGAPLARAAHKAGRRVTTLDWWRRQRPDGARREMPELTSSRQISTSSSPRSCTPHAHAPDRPAVHSCMLN